MKSIIKRPGFALFSTMLVAIGSDLYASEANQYQIDADAATAYAAAYSSQDIETLRELLAEDVVFVDPSNHYVGKDAVLAGFRDGFKRVTGTGPETREISKFRSGNEFVYTAFLDFNMLMQVGELPEREYNFKVDFAIILKVQSGLIVHHADYVDTDAFVAQLQTQTNSQ